MKLRAVVLAVAGAGIPLALLILFLPLTWGYGGYFQAPTRDGTIVVYSDPNGPAYAAGLRVGQHVRRSGGYAAVLEDAGPVGTVVPIHIIEPRGERTLKVTFVPYSGALAVQQNFSKILAALTALFAFVICILVVTRARDPRIGSRAASVLLVAAIGAFCQSAALVSGNAWINNLCYWVVPPFCSIAAIAAGLHFLTIYPPQRTRVRTLAGYVSYAALIYATFIAAQWLYMQRTGSLIFFRSIESSLFPLAFIAVFAIAVVDGIRHAGERDAAAMRWLGAMWLLAAAFLSLPAIGALAHIDALTTHYGDIFAAAAVFCLAFGVAYPILRHRLVDLNILVSRATVFTVVSALIVGIFIAAEWAIGRIFEQSFGLANDRSGWTAQILTLLVVLILGISARSIHQFVDVRLSNVFFKTRMRALEEITRVAKESDASTDAQAVLDIACDTIVRCLRPPGAAAYLRGDGGYVLASESGERISPQTYAFNDPIGLRLRRWQEPFEIDDDSDARLHMLFLPMTLRGELLGFIACGPKPDHTAYLSDDVAALSLLAHHAGIAAAWLNRAPAFDSLQESDLLASKLTS